MNGKTGNLELLTRSINQLIGSVSTTVAETMQVVQRAVEGDLTSRVKVDDKSGHFKALAVSVNSMIQSMMEVVTGLTKTSHEVQAWRRGDLPRQPRIEQANRGASLQPGGDGLLDGTDDLDRQEQRG